MAQMSWVAVNPGMTISSVPVWSDVAFQRYGSQPSRRGFRAVNAVTNAVAAAMHRHPGVRRAATRVKDGLAWLMVTLGFVTIVAAIVVLPGLLGD